MGATGRTEFLHRPDAFILPRRPKRLRGRMNFCIFLLRYRYRDILEFIWLLIKEEVSSTL